MNKQNERKIMLQRIDKLPLFYFYFIFVIVLGYVDSLPGEFPVLVLYVIPILLVTWSKGPMAAVVISLACGVVHLVADYYGHASSNFKATTYYHDVVFLFFVGSLIALLKNLWSEDK